MQELEYIKAFKMLLEKSLGADSKKKVTVFYDEDFLNYFKYLSKEINKSKLKVTYIFIPKSYQEVLLNNEEFHEEREIQLPHGVRPTVSNSDVVINFLTDTSGSSKVRMAVVNLPLPNGCKVATCPQINDEILKLILLSPFEEINNNCELFAWAIGNSNSVKIITQDGKGKQCELNIGLEGWGNEPFISSGVICENSWGNVPPGETFCCPDPKNVNGTICINGSVPGHAFEAGEYLELEFTKGKITNWKASSQTLKSYITNLENDAKMKNDEHWNTFSELGIGLNPIVTTLTGNPLFDEKMASTIHIAIGSNTQFGHNIQSFIHKDLVILNPTFYFDKRLVIDKGKILFDAIKEWRNKFTVPDINLKKRTFITFIQPKIHINKSEIKRKLNTGKRVGHIDILGENMELHTPTIFSILEEVKERPISYEYLIKRFGEEISTHDFNKIIAVFFHYKMLEISNKR